MSHEDLGFWKEVNSSFILQTQSCLSLPIHLSHHMPCIKLDTLESVAMF